MLDLIIVTGASKGIGKNIAKQCSTFTKNLIGISSTDALLELEVPNKDCILSTIKTNLSDYEYSHNVVKRHISNLENINGSNFKNIGIVLCASNIGEPGGIFNSNIQTWGKQYESNVLGNLAMIKACTEQVKEGVKLRVVCFAGGGAAYGYPDFSGYALTKVATVRAVENIGMEFDKLNLDASIVAIAPGAVDTDTLKVVVDNGGYVKTRTDISEPTDFVCNFLQDKMPSKKINGKFVHVRDDIDSADFSNKELFTLRRVQ